MNIPWISILTSRSTWIVTIGQWGHAWSIYTVITQSPTYFKHIHGMSISLVGVISGIPYILKMIFGYLFAIFCDYFISTKKLSHGNARKLGMVFCSIVHGVFIVGIGCSGCDIILALVFLILAITVHGAVSAGSLASIIDMSPNFSGIILGISSVFSASTGFLSPIVVSYLTDDNVCTFWLYLLRCLTLHIKKIDLFHA